MEPVTCSTCLYNCAARLTSPAWGPICFAGTLASTGLSCLSHAICGCPSKKRLDECGISILHASSFAPHANEALYQQRFIFYNDGQKEPLVVGTETWSAHASACCMSTTAVSCYATFCGIFGVPCSWCPANAEDSWGLCQDPCIVCFETLTGLTY